jgi:hypothetical protein
LLVRSSSLCTASTRALQGVKLCRIAINRVDEVPSASAAANVQSVRTDRAAVSLAVLTHGASSQVQTMATTFLTKVGFNVRTLGSASVVNGATGDGVVRPYSPPLG